MVAACCTDAAVTAATALMLLLLHCYCTAAAAAAAAATANAAAAAAATATATAAATVFPLLLPLLEAVLHLREHGSIGGRERDAEGRERLEQPHKLLAGGYWHTGACGNRGKAQGEGCYTAKLCSV